MKKIIIAAISKNGVIGKSDGHLPWHIPDEFKHFKETTFGFPILMGRKTFQALGKPLIGRENIVVSSNLNFNIDFENTYLVHTLEEGFNKAQSFKKEKMFIIGGGTIYKQSINYADEMLLSFLNIEAEGEIYFPQFDENEWEKSIVKEHEVFTVYSYVRKVI